MVKAAERQSPAGPAAVLRRLRLAWFLKVRPIDDRDELLALAAELEGIDAARPAADFAGAMRLHALHTDMALAGRPERVALALRKTAQPPGEPGPRFSTPTRLRGAWPHRDGAGIPAARDLRADAPYPRAGARTPPRRRARRIPGTPRRGTAGHRRSSGCDRSPGGRHPRRAPGAGHRRVAHRIAVGDEDELLFVGPPAVELRCRGARATGADRAATCRRLTAKRHDAREIAAIVRSGADCVNVDWLRWRAVDRGRVGFGGRARVDATLETGIPPCQRLPHLHAESWAPR